MAQGGTDAAPVFTEVRIEAVRNYLRALMKALKAGYSEATAAKATRKQREDANLLGGSFSKALEEVENEYRTSVVTTDDVAFAANGLLSELQVYRAVLGERFPQLDTAAGTAETEEGSGESTSENAVAAPGSGDAPNVSTEGQETTTDLSAIGERGGESFALPPRPPTTPRTPRTPARARIPDPIYRLAPDMNASTSTTASVGGGGEKSKFTRAIAFMNQKIKDRSAIGVGVGAQTSFASLQSIANASTIANDKTTDDAAAATTETGQTTLETSSATIVGDQRGRGVVEPETTPAAAPETGPEAASAKERPPETGGAIPKTTVRRKAASRASTASQLSMSAAKELKEDVARIQRRKEDDKRDAEIRMLDLERQMEEIRRSAEMKDKINDRNIAALQRTHEENQRMIEEEEEEEEEEAQRLEYTVAGFEAQRLEYTVAGIGVLPADDKDGRCAHWVLGDSAEESRVEAPIGASTAMKPPKVAVNEEFGAAGE